MAATSSNPTSSTSELNLNSIDLAAFEEQLTAIASFADLSETMFEAMSVKILTELMLQLNSESIKFDASEAIAPH